MDLRQRAQDLAQDLMRAMLDAGVQGDANAPLTMAYVSAERVVDALDGFPRSGVEWEKAKAELDALIAGDTDADPDFDDRGNHFLFPEGVVEGLPEFNGSFR